MFLVGPATPGEVGPWVRDTVVGRYVSVRNLPVTGAPASGGATTGVAVGLVGPVSPPWTGE